MAYGVGDFQAVSFLRRKTDAKARRYAYRRRSSDGKGFNQFKQLFDGFTLNRYKFVRQLSLVYKFEKTARVANPL
jgi:hypothetical protein